jgi:hypothetical protein
MAQTVLNERHMPLFSCQHCRCLHVIVGSHALAVLLENPRCWRRVQGAMQVYPAVRTRGARALAFPAGRALPGTVELGGN